MKKFTHSARWLLCLSLLLVPSAAFAQASPQVSASVTVRPGTELELQGSGFQAGEGVSFTLDGEAGSFGSAVVTAGGAFSASPTVPAGTLPGEHLVVVTGEASGVMVSTAFKVSSPWSQYGYRQNNTHYNPYENIINPGNVAQLQRAWRTRGTSGGEVLAAAGRLYSHSGDVFSLASGRFLHSDGVSTYGAVYGKTYATDNTGLLLATAQDCTPNLLTQPPSCSPSWTAKVSDSAAGPVTVADHRLYLPTNEGVVALNAECLGATCAPVWRGEHGLTKPIVSNGVVYVQEPGIQIGENSALYAYAVDCRSDGGTCAPLWQFQLPGRISGELVVSEGRLFVALEGDLTVFREKCWTRPEGCRKLWTSQFRVSHEPAIANGLVYISGHAYPVDCRRDGGVCEPLWTYLSGSSYPDTIAGGLVWNGANKPGFISATPAVCAVGSVCGPVWVSEPTAEPNFLNGSVVVSDGMVLAPSGDTKIYAYRLPESVVAAMH